MVEQLDEPGEPTPKIPRLDQGEDESSNDPSSVANFNSTFPNLQTNTIPNLQPTIPNIQPTIPNIQPNTIPNLQPTIPNIQPNTIPNLQPTIPNIHPNTIPNLQPNTIPNLQPTIPNIQPTIPNLQPNTFPNIQPTIPNLQPNTIPNLQPTIMPNLQLTRLTSPAVATIEGSTRKDVRSLCISDSSVNCWIFPVAVALNKINNRQQSGNFSCTLISLVLGKALLSLPMGCPDDGVLSEVWYSLIVNCTRLGNEIYDSSSLGARNLSPNVASATLKNLSPVKLDPAIPVRLVDSNRSSRLQSQIIEKLKGKDATALYIYSSRTVLLYTNKNNKILLIDNHQHSEKMGPVIVKGTCNRLHEFITSIQTILNINDSSYAELIVFS